MGIIGDIARYVIQGCFDGLYELEKTSRLFLTRHVPILLLLYNLFSSYRGKRMMEKGSNYTVLEPLLAVCEPFYPQEGLISMLFNLSS